MCFLMCHAMAYVLLPLLMCHAALCCAKLLEYSQHNLMDDLREDVKMTDHLHCKS